MNRSAREGKSVKRFERSNGPDIALYKNYIIFFFNSFASAPLNATKIAVKKVSDVDVRMFTPEF